MCAKSEWSRSTSLDGTKHICRDCTASDDSEKTVETESLAKGIRESREEVDNPTAEQEVASPIHAKSSAPHHLDAVHSLAARADTLEARGEFSAATELFEAAASLLTDDEDNELRVDLIRRASEARSLLSKDVKENFPEAHELKRLDELQQRLAHIVVSVKERAEECFITSRMDAAVELRKVVYLLMPEDESNVTALTLAQVELMHQRESSSCYHSAECNDISKRLDGAMGLLRRSARDAVDRHEFEAAIKLLEVALQINPSCEQLKGEMSRAETHRIAHNRRSAIVDTATAQIYRVQKLLRQSVDRAMRSGQVISYCTCDLISITI